MALHIVRFTNREPNRSHTVKVNTDRVDLTYYKNEDQPGKSGFAQGVVIGKRRIGMPLADVQAIERLMNGGSPAPVPDDEPDEI